MLIRQNQPYGVNENTLKASSRIAIIVKFIVHLIKAWHKTSSPCGNRWQAHENV